MVKGERMRLFYKTIFTVSILLLMSTTKYYGQTADLQFVVTQNDQTVNGTYSVKTQIKLNTEADMGTSAIQFTFNTNGLDFPASPDSNAGDYHYHNFNGSIPGGVPFTFYPSHVSRPISGKVSINIVLSLGADGQTITTSWMDIATISFTILDVNESSNLQWVPETTTIFDDLNNQFTNGTFSNIDNPLPVELSTFTAKYNEKSVKLDWVTKTEVNNYGFNVERRINEGEWNNIAFIEGHGNSNSPKEYSYSDNDVYAGGSKFQYRLKQVDNDGSFEYSDIVEVEIVPNQYDLSQNYPNPFNPSTTIRFSLPEQTKLKINLYSMLGELVETIAEGNYEAGNYKVNFNASNLPSGVYVYRIESSDFVDTKKMMLLK